MMRDYKHLIGLQHICMEQIYLKYMKVKGSLLEIYLLKIT